MLNIYLLQDPAISSKRPSGPRGLRLEPPQHRFQLFSDRVECKFARWGSDRIRAGQYGDDGPDVGRGWTDTGTGTELGAGAGADTMTR